MARWPTAGNVYPVTPKAYPVLPKAYPGSSVARFPNSAEFNFASIASATLSADYDARKGVTFAGPTNQNPAAGPAVTLSGSLGPFTTTPGNLCVITRADGVTFDYSFDGGVNWPDGVGGRAIPAGSSYQPPAHATWGGGAVTPPLISFAAGTYGTRYYAPQLTGWADQVAGHNLVVAGSAGPVITTRGRSVNIYGRGRPGVTGRTSITADGINTMKVADAMAQAVAGSSAGVAKAFDVYLVLSEDLHGAAAQNTVGFGTTSGSTAYVNMGEYTAPNHTVFSCVNDAVANIPAGVLSVTDTADTRSHIWRFQYQASAGGSVTAYKDGVSVLTATGLRGACTNLNVFTLFGLIRNNIVIQPSFSTLARCLVFAGETSAGDAAIILAQLTAIHDCAAPRNVRVSVDGDSFAAASGGESAWPNVMVFGNDAVTYVNAAVSGSDMAAVISRAATVDANYSAGAVKNILFIQVGTNDIASVAGQEGALRTNLTSYITARKAVGWYVIINTIIPRAGMANASFATEAAANNAWRISGGSGANAVVDTTSTWAGAPNDQIWYRDDVHPGDQGASWFADRMEVAFRAA